VSAAALTSYRRMPDRLYDDPMSLLPGAHALAPPAAAEREAARGEEIRQSGREAESLRRVIR